MYNFFIYDDNFYYDDNFNFIFILHHYKKDCADFVVLYIYLLQKLHGL